MSTKHPFVATLLTAMAAAPLIVMAASSTNNVVAVDAGKLRGNETGTVSSWKGIPFAAPPVGANRWRAPQPVTPWHGVRDATLYGPDCMQVPFPSDAAPLGTTPAEDCLYANIWRPAKADKKLPVIFWIYGGGFVNGGASPPTYSGARLANQGVLVFSANYRVGRFGTFAHPQLSKDDADQGRLGNYGYMDQIAALHWVHRNIAAFGGDPGNVTIVGESAGGMSVHTLVTSPVARGLFQKAVVMSGGNGVAMGEGNLAAVEKIGVEFAATKGIAAGDPDALAKLRALSAAEITSGLNMMALFAPGPRTFAGPFVDGRVAVDAGDAYRTGDFEKVPMMIGATSADMGGKTGFMVAGARSVSAEISDRGVPVYAYRFSYVAESLDQTGAQHATDIPFFFDTQAIKYADKITTRDNGMGKTISAYLVNFARNGDPNGTGLAEWPRYSRASDQIMDFAENGKAVAHKDPLGTEIDAKGAPGRP
jgi:para-nitrobenzyl esterase